MTSPHFVCDFPPIWEHTGAGVILGEYIDDLMKVVELKQGRAPTAVEVSVW